MLHAGLRRYARDALSSDRPSITSPMRFIILLGVTCVLLILFSIIKDTDALCLEARRLRDTPTTHERWVRWVPLVDRGWAESCFHKEALDQEFGERSE